MKLTTGILATALTMAAAAACIPQAAAQNPDAIDNARSMAKSLQQKQQNDSNAALDAAGVTAKPSPSAPAPAVKPAAIPSSKPATTVSAAKSAAPSASSAANKLEHVSVAQDADTVKIELSSSQAVEGQVYKMNSPARVVVELPATAAATAQNKIPVNSAGVKGVRIGMDGKNPPTTSIVVDLDSSLAYELTPGASDKLILTLHTKGGAPVVAKNTPAATSPAPAKTTTVASAKPAPSAAKTTAAVVATTATAVTAKSIAATAKAQPAPAKSAAKPQSKPATKTEVAKVAAKPETKEQAKDAKAAASVPETTAANVAETAKKPEDKKEKPEDKKWAMNGKRDPFFSPVVQQGGSGCSTGKKCLEIGNINLRGVVKSDTGFIAVVTNNLNKAYFLRENDPVFNGYVVKITGDSVVFQETVQDKLGKPFTREVVKKIFTPAV